MTILSLCDEVEALLKDADPAPDAATTRRVQALCARMKGHDSYIDEKAGKISSRAEIYFSARKHEKWPGGANGCMQEMRYSYLPGIREQAQVYLRKM